MTLGYVMSWVGVVFVVSVITFIFCATVAGHREKASKPLVTVGAWCILFAVVSAAAWLVLAFLYFYLDSLS